MTNVNEAAAAAHETAAKAHTHAAKYAERYAEAAMDATSDAVVATAWREDEASTETAFAEGEAGAAEEAWQYGEATHAMAAHERAANHHRNAARLLRAR